MSLTMPPVSFSPCVPLSLMSRLGMNPQLFVCPFITYAVIMAYCALWLVLSMYIMTADNVEEDPDTGYVQFNNHPKVRWA